METPPRLLFPARPTEGGSLMGMIMDAAHDNVHGTVAHVLAAAGHPHHGSFDLAVSRLDLLPRLAGVLGVDPVETAVRAHPPIDHRQGNGPELVDFFGAAVPASDLIHRRRRVAPGSLRIATHHRALWTHALVPYCPESGDELLETCPSCGHGLRWHRAVGTPACDACGRDLREALAPGPDEAVRAVVDPLIDLLSPVPDRHVPASARLHPDLCGLGRGGAFELGWRIACALGAPAGTLPRGRHSSLPAEDRLATLIEAANVLSGWPERIEERLEAIGDAEGPERLTAVITRLRTDLHRRRAGGNIAMVLEGGLPHVFGRGGLRTRRVVLTYASGLVDGTTAGRILGTGSRKFAALHRSTLVAAQTCTGTANRFGTFAAADLEEDRAALADRIPIGQAKRRLGVTVGGVEQLECLGELHRHDRPVMLQAYPGVQLSRKAFDDLERRLFSAARDVPDADVPLNRAVRTIAGEKPYGPIIADMAAGLIPFALSANGSSFADRALLRSCDLHLLMHRRFERNRYPDFPFDGTVTRLDASDTLNLAAPQMALALAEELAGACAEGFRLRRADVSLLATQRISATEILARWTSGGRRLPDALGAAPALQRLGPAGWDRSEVESRFA